MSFTKHESLFCEDGVRPWLFPHVKGGAGGTKEYGNEGLEWCFPIVAKCGTRKPSSAWEHELSMCGGSVFNKGSDFNGGSASGKSGTSMLV